MAEGFKVEGPAWTGIGVNESTGRYPLRVETAVSSLVARLLPGVITTTRHARMYSVHTLAWAEAHERDLSYSDAQTLVRRCEVVTAAIHHLHEPHRVELSSAHGEGEIQRFISDDVLDVVAAASPGGLSQDGFSGVYQGPCVRIGLLTDDSYPRPGARADLLRLRSGLAGLVELADRDRLTLNELREAGQLCLCEAALHGDGEWLREVLVEDATDHMEDRYRQLTCGLLLDCLDASPSARPNDAFRDRLAFGSKGHSQEGDERSLVEALWQAAALRNFSVSAWRGLWQWLAATLNAEPMTVHDLGERLADELDDVTVSQVLADLPDRVIHSNQLLPAELELQALPVTPMRYVRELALGSKRLKDLRGATLRAFVGSDSSDLGPRWVEGLLEENRDRHVRDVARELAVILVRRAQRVALSKMTLGRDGLPFVPTRLRDRDGLLSIRGEESAGNVALRIDSLADILTGIGYLNLDDDHNYILSDMGVGLRERIN